MLLPRASGVNSLNGFEKNMLPLNVAITSSILVANKLAAAVNCDA